MSIRSLRHKRRGLREGWDGDILYEVRAKCPSQLEFLGEIVPQYEEDIQEDFLEQCRSDVRALLLRKAKVEFSYDSGDIKMTISGYFDEEDKETINYYYGESSFQSFLDEQWDEFVFQNRETITDYLWEWFDEQ